MLTSALIRSVAQLKALPKSSPTSTDITPIPTPDTSRPSTPSGHILSATKGTSRRAKKSKNAALVAATQSSGDEARRRPKPTKAGSKKQRKWDADGLADEEDDVTLDYSIIPDTGADSSRETATEHIDAESFGTRTGKGQFILKDLEHEVNSILKDACLKKADATAPTGGVVGSGLNAISGLFRNMVGGKVLTKADLEKPMKGMQEHLLNKNVAQEATVRLCEGVEKELIGVKTGSFESEYSLFRAWIHY